MPTHAYLPASPFDVEHGLIDYAVDQRRSVGGRELTLTVEPLLVRDPRLGPVQSVRLRWSDGGPIEAGLRVAVTLGDEPVEPVRRLAEADLRLLVPRVERPRPLRIELPDHGVGFELTLEPQREWEIHLIHHSHYDIGYTDPQAVVHAQHLSYLDDVLRLARATDDRDEPVRFRWAEEALYSVTEWLANRTPQQAAEFDRRVREGRISVSAMPFNLHTEVCSVDELHEMLRPARELRERFGWRLRTAMQTDVPGSVVGLPDVLGAAGVDFLSVAHNWAGRSNPHGTGGAELPRLFRWRGRQGHEITVWRTDSPHGLAYMEGSINGLHESYASALTRFPSYLASLAKRPYPLPPGGVFGWLEAGTPVERQPYPWDILHLRLMGTGSDNGGPNRTVSDIAAQWNAEWDYPRLRVSTNEDFLDAATARLGDRLETHTGDWADWWGHGVGSAAPQLAIGRRAQVGLRDAQTMAAGARLLGAGPADAAVRSVVDPRRGYQQLGLWDEHTWGASNSWCHTEDGHSSGVHQWHWKAARAYEALDESELGLQRAGSSLAAALAPGAEASVYLGNTSGRIRTEVAEFFVPASLVPADRALRVTDARTGSVLPHDERAEEQAARAVGRYVRVLVEDAPSVGLVRLDLAGTDPEPPGDRPPALEPPTVLENEFLRVRLDPQDGTICSIHDQRADREIVDTGAALGFNAYVYDRYATVGHSNHNSSKFAAAPGSFGLLSSRDVGGPVAVLEAGCGAVDRWLRVVSTSAAGCDRLETTYRLRHDRGQLDIVNRLVKSATPDKESAFFAFPFAAAQPRVLAEGVGGLTGRDRPAVPGGADYLTAVQHWVSVEDRTPGAGAAVGWATAEAPLVEIGHIALPYVPFPNSMGTDEPATVYSWVHNNIWDTNFPVEQAFDLEFRYTVLVGPGSGPAVATAAAESLVQPLRPVIAAGAGKPLVAASLLAVSNPDVRLVGLVEIAPDRLLARLFCADPDGARTTLRLPPGARAAQRSSYWGDPLAELDVVDGTVEIGFDADGAGAVAIDLG